MHVLTSTAITVRARILGPLHLSVNGRPVEIRPGRPRRVLLHMLLVPGRHLTVDALLDQHWAGERLAHPRNAVQIVVSHLRKALDSAAGAGHLIETVDNGYRLAVERDDVDAFQFEHAVRSLTEVGHPVDRLAAVAAALAMWRGDPLADAAYEDFAQSSIRRLHEVRLHAMEVQAESLLELGRHAEAVGALVSLVDEYPLHERFHVLLMTALYRAGRQADALRRYDAARTVLREELGIDPGPELRATVQAVLDQSPALDWRPAPPALATVTPIGACA